MSDTRLSPAQHCFFRSPTVVGTCTYDPPNRWPTSSPHRLASTVCAVRFARPLTTRLLTVERPMMVLRSEGVENASSAHADSRRSSGSKTFQSWWSSAMGAANTSTARKCWRAYDRQRKTWRSMEPYSKRWLARSKSNFGSKVAKFLRAISVRPCCNGCEPLMGWRTCGLRVCIRTSRIRRSSPESSIFWRRRQRVRRSVALRSPPGRNPYLRVRMRVRKNCRERILSLRVVQLARVTHKGSPLDGEQNGFSPVDPPI
jgi:hypothetical protein